MGHTHRVLVVDDEAVNIEIMNGILEKEYQVLFSTTGKDAIERATTEKPDLILLDILMPDMNGHEVLSLLKQNKETSEIPVIYVTALSESKYESTGLEIGAVDYLTKPINPTVALARVKNHLERYQAIRKSRTLAQKLSMILRSVGDGVFGMERDGTISFINPAAEWILGYSDKEMYQITINSFFPHDDDKSAHALMEAMNSGTALREEHAVFERKGGSAVPVEYIVNPLVDTSGIVGAVCIFRDISARLERADQEISQAVHRSVLHALIETGSSIPNLDQLFSTALNMLQSVPWLAPSPRGALFWREDTLLHGPEALILKTWKNIPDSLLNHYMEHGVMGTPSQSAVEQSQPLFMERADTRFSNDLSEMEPHGQLCIPVVEGTEVVGVLTLILPNGTHPNPHETDFAAFYMTALAGLVNQKSNDPDALHAQ
ncbi:MAG: response regulator [Magnetococcales bacterium]|nr:response regulator [Magnetococcales bacterium]